MRSDILIVSLLLASSTLLLTGLSPARAREIVQLEPVGPTSAVIETDLVDELRQRAVNVDVEQLRSAQARYQPANLHVLPRATKDFPSITVNLSHTPEEDVQDANGRVLPARLHLQPAAVRHPVRRAGGSSMAATRSRWPGSSGSPYGANRRALLLLSGAVRRGLA